MMRKKSAATFWYKQVTWPSNGFSCMLAHEHTPRMQASRFVSCCIA
uniref:Uncharacterized protein n=1 Tax=Arundo donax TaxID=35708 RepID=A0A0A9ENN2_ARUDO